MDAVKAWATSQIWDQHGTKEVAKTNNDGKYVAGDRVVDTADKADKIDVPNWVVNKARVACLAFAALAIFAVSAAAIKDPKSALELTKKSVIALTKFEASQDYAKTLAVAFATVVGLCKLADKPARFVGSYIPLVKAYV